VILGRLLRRIYDGGVPVPPPQIAAQNEQASTNLALKPDLSDACGHYEKLVEIDPGDVAARHKLGTLLAQNGNLVAAAEHLDHAVLLAPEFADAHAARGNLWLLQHNDQAAAASYRHALRLDDKHPGAHFNLGLILHNSGAHAEALQHYEAAYAVSPDIHDLLKNLTLLNIEFERYDAAQSLLQEVLTRLPSHFDALKCMGLVMQKLHRPREALPYYEHARSLNAADAELLNNLGIVYQDLGRLEEALDSYNAAIWLKPDFPLAIWHRSLAYLLRQDFVRGWPDYELRLVSLDLPKRTVDFPRWNGGDLRGKRLLVYGEQGLGDEIMFASCLPHAVAASEHCVIECSPKLESLFRRSFPDASVYSLSQDKALPRDVLDQGIDAQVPIGSLPMHFRRTVTDFPTHHGYLQADATSVAAWRTRLAKLGPGLKVGISWQGGTAKTRRAVRSLPLTKWAPILRVPNVHYVDLQYTDSQAELAALEASLGVHVHSWQDTKDNYDENAAMIAALDLVISVCTAVIHLGGALGRPVWVMAPFSPEWRYGIAGDAMPWYPSVRVFRQPVYNDWDAVICNVARSLKEIA